MTYPWPSFGSSFTFRREEQPVPGTDTWWSRQAEVRRFRPLGTAVTDPDVVMRQSSGSAQRSFECWMDPDRFDTLAALTGSVDTFTDWGRPTPDSRSACLLAAVVQGEGIFPCGQDGASGKRFRVQLSWLAATTLS